MRKKQPTSRIVRAISEMLETRALFDVTPITFATSVGFVAGTAPDAIATADFNADGNVDLAVADHSTDKVNVFFGNGSGTFSAGPVLSLSAPPVAILTGDFNGDGKPDIAVATTATANQSNTSVDVFLNTGAGTFGLGQITTLETSATAGEPISMTAGHFTSSGHLDLAVTAYNADGAGDTAAEVLLGTGTGTFGTPMLYGVPGYATAIATGDFNNDGDLDLAVASTTVNVVSGATDDGSATNTVSLFSGNGAGAFSPGTAINISTAGVVDSISVANLTSAGTLGLLVGSTDGTVTVIPNTGGNFNVSAVATVAGGTGVTAVGDFNLDGNADFVSANGGGLYPFNSVTIVPGQGGGSISTAQTLATGADPMAVAVADFNNDGKPDIVTANEGDGTVSVLLNTTAVTQVASKISLVSDNASVPAGTTVTLTATVNGVSVSPLTGESIPTGTVYFYDGATLLGSSPLVSGTDQTEFQVSSLIVGSHALHAVYGGDTAYTGSKSAAITQVISPTATQGPDLVGTLLTTTLPATLAPGETGTVRVQITNQGNTPGVGLIENAAYLSLDNTVDPGSITLPIRGGLARANLHLKAGQSEIVTGTVTVPQNTPLATYSLLVQLNTTGSLAESVPGNNTVVSPTNYTVANVFGTVAGRAGVVLKVADDSGTTGQFRLTGPGSGTVNVGDEGVQINLTGTTAASVLTMTTSRGSALFSATSLADDSAIGSIRAASVSISNTLTLPGGAGVITLGSFGGTSAGTINLGAGGLTAINIAAVANADINASGGIQSLTVGSWASGSITAAWIGTLRSTHGFNADLTLSGSGAPGSIALKSMIVGGTAAGNVLIMGNAGRISLASTAVLTGNWNLNASGSVQSVSLGASFYGTLFAGSIGAMQIHGDLDTGVINSATNLNSLVVSGRMINATVRAATASVGTLGSLRVTGGATTSLVIAGTDNYSPTPNENGTIKSVTVLGPVDTASKFLAARLPAHAIIDGKRVDPASDGNFIPGLVVTIG